MLSRRELLLGRTDLDQSAKALLSSESGASAVEYGVLAGLISIILVSGLKRFGKQKRRA